MVIDHAHSRKTALRALVINAADIIAPVWPMKTIIACNPLQGFENLPFQEAITKAHGYLGGRGFLDKSIYKDDYHQGKISKAHLQYAFDNLYKGLPEKLKINEYTLNLKVAAWAYLTEDYSAKPINDVLDDAINPIPIQLLTDLCAGDETAQTVNAQLVKWLSAFLDEGMANLPMPDRQDGFYKAWQSLGLFDHDIHHGHQGVIKFLKGLPAESVDALIYAFETMGLAEEKWEEYLRLSLAKLYGWSGFIKWRSQQPGYAYQQKAPITLIDYLAVRLSIECAVVMFTLNGASIPGEPLLNQLLTRYDLRSKKINGDLLGLYHCLLNKANLEENDLGKITDPAMVPCRDFLSTFISLEPFIWLQAKEAAYRAPLLSDLKDNVQVVIKNQAKSTRSKAQLVFCIDVRSEPMRRAIEHTGDYQTFGFAGFFGLPIRTHAFDNQGSCDVCPVLLKPKHDIYEEPIAFDAQLKGKYTQGKKVLTSLKDIYHDLKFNLGTPFALAEAYGPWSGLLMLGRTVWPSQFANTKDRAITAIRPHIKTRPRLAIKSVHQQVEGISFSEQALYAQAFLQLIGLTSNFAPLVLLCGHGSRTENNPYASALDCGACGGNHGGGNAKVMSAILNNPQIRVELHNRGILIPEDTYFLPMEHNTTTDEMFWLDEINYPHHEMIQQLKADLIVAGQKNNAVRLKKFGIDLEPQQAMAQTFERSCDWAQLRPEWGLAGNAAFIVAPRSLTAGIDLHGRCFLHSYDWRQDETGKSLETILTAPMVVAQWINSQYYFSTVDNVAYGGGSKVTQNIVGGFGVMQGNGSDLMHGLSLQSVFASDQQLYHEPLRLMVVVYAPKELIEGLIKKHSILQRLFYNGWVSLRVIEPSSADVLGLSINGTWEKTEEVL